MATSCAEEKWEHSEDEEALSLCDLPVNLVQEENENNDKARIKEEEEAETGHHEEFDFGPWRGSFGMKTPEMCVADDIFYQGQILPLSVSVSSETPSLPNKSKDETFNSNITCLSRSDSLDHSDLGFTSFSSRSSSSRSSAQYSTTSSNNTTQITTRRHTDNKPANIIQTRFHACPSPNPQIRLSRPSMESNRTRKSSVWDFFRLGPVRTPEIELQDLKARNSVSRNSSCSSSHSNPSTKMIRTNDGKKKQRKQRMLSGCSCTVSDVKPVPMNVTVTRTNKYRNIEQKSGYEKLVTKKKIKQKEVEKEGGDGGRKQAMSRHRTYEWIKELSHARYDVNGDGGGGQDS